MFYTMKTIDNTQNIVLQRYFSYKIETLLWYSLTNNGTQIVKPNMLHNLSRRRCENQDSLTVFVYINNKEEKLGVFCGRQTPPILMSPGPRMKVIFKSESSPKDNNSGFELAYSFRTGKYFCFQCLWFGFIKRVKQTLGLFNDNFYNNWL